jgi:lipopolysaccharide/colanic/teichoic acid biosynthesis glycosyltransferase/glycosyltransferase involved in cell wall biosynthesis
MKILIVHQYYLMPGAPGGSRFNEMAAAWSRAGHDVTVIAGALDYATGETPARFRRRWLTNEQDGAVRVWRCYVPSSYNKSYLGRALAFIGFALSAATAALRAGRHDVVVATSPPLLAVLPGWIAARCRPYPSPWVFEVRDLWPESAITTGVLAERSLITRLLFALEHWAYRHATRVNVLTPAFADNIVARGLATRDKITEIPNGADVDVFKPAHASALRSELGWTGRFVALYAGAHGRANAIGQLVSAAERLRHRPNILIATVGDGPERAEWQRVAQEKQLTNIVFLGARPKSEMPGYVNAADAGMAVLQRNPTFKTVYPNKVFDYMACERPVVLAIDGVARRLVCDNAQAGIFAEPEDPEAIASAIETLADDRARCRTLGQSGRQWVLAHATREALAARYLTVLEELAGSDNKGVARVAAAAKRTFDVVVATTALLLLWPVLGVIWLAVRLGLGGPALFEQVRPGLAGKPFTLWKFRTMTDERDGSGRLRTDAERLTRFGQLLRSWSLDELPELWNVLRGDMSLVGPRPLLVSYLERYTPEQARRHEAKPGITGWAQIHGRNSLSWDEKFSLDVWYVDHRSFALDLQILLRSIGKVLNREGISQAGEATAAEFMGTQNSAHAGNTGRRPAELHETYAREA